MLDSILRKGRQLAADPVLRRWLMARALKCETGEPSFTAHRPPYLGADWSGLAEEKPSAGFAPLAAGEPREPILIRLAGEHVRVNPGEADLLVARAFADIETRLSLHRFAWVPLMGGDDDPRWVGAIWTAWVKLHGRPTDDWPWHPYTAAERAINLLDFARSHGLPGPTETTLGILAAHAPAIAARLEWFGDHHTSNHCANNGRGLYLLGLALGLADATEAGARILLAEGARIFRASGVLREASTHYHLLLTRQWASIWLAARAQNRPEAETFEGVLRKALAVLHAFDLPGGLPLIGDVSPDCPPAHLAGLLPGRDGTTGWTGRLPEAERAALAALRESCAPPDANQLLADGWLRRDYGLWAGLWHAEEAGWSPMPGHGHQDCGAAEFHYAGEPIFVDPGRGSYELAGEADPYVAGGVHGTLCIDGADPYPPNRPYYSAAFRRSQAGAATLDPDGAAVVLEHGGFARLGANRVTRRWQFDQDMLIIDDRVDGHGRHAIGRRLATGHDVAVTATGADITTASGRRFRITAEGTPPSCTPVALWSAYGEGQPGTMLTFTTTARLPWHGRLTVEVL